MVRGSIRNDYGKQEFTGGDRMTKITGTFPPIALSVVGTVTTIGGAALMFTSPDYSISTLVQPLGVFFLGVFLSSVAIVLRKKQQKQKGQVENGKQEN